MNRVIQKEALSFLQRTQEKFDLALYDPPYNTGEIRYGYQNTFKDFKAFLYPILEETKKHLNETGAIALHIGHKNYST